MHPTEAWVQARHRGEKGGAVVERWAGGKDERGDGEQEADLKKIESPLDQKCPFRQALRQWCMHRRGKAEV